MQNNHEGEEKDDNKPDQISHEALDGDVPSQISQSEARLADGGALANNDAEDAEIAENAENASEASSSQPTETPKPTDAETVPLRYDINNLERIFAPRQEQWSEPLVSQTHESTSKMYTPGISVDQNYPRRRLPEPVAEYSSREESNNNSGRFARMVFLVLICAIASAAATYGVMEYRFNRGDFTVVNTVVLGGGGNRQDYSGLSVPGLTQGAGMSAEDIYVLACSQVVSITTKIDYNSGMFGGWIPSSDTAESGSGFIISSDGYILTNYHVVESSYIYDLPLIVNLNDGTEYEAAVIGYDQNNDVALIKIDATGLNPAVIANSDNISVGQTVYAVGNPLGELVYTMTDGIVSARDREVSVEGKTINTFQFSAAVNSGNSGGPLYDTNGEVIGIVTAKPRTASVEGIGFAIPINDAIVIAIELIEYGYITGRPLMGITVQAVTSANADFWDLVVGVRVMSVMEGSAAEKAGLLVGDIITGLDDTEVISIESLTFYLRRFRAGESSVVEVWREGEYLELPITFDEDLSAGQARQ